MNQLDPPPLAFSNSEATEVLRVWAAPEAPQQLTLRPTWQDPGAWGLLLVDIARHAANAYEAEGENRGASLARIRQSFEAEWAAPTDTPERL